MAKILTFIIISLTLSVSFAGNRDPKIATQAIIKELDLTADQAKKVRAIKEKYHAAADQQRKASAAIKEDFISSFQVPNRDPQYKKELIEKYKKYQETKREIHFRKFEMALEIRDVLTDEQLKKFRALQDKHSERK